MSFAYDSCIGCSRRWSPTDTRKGNEWWPLRDQDIQPCCCYRCISRAWLRAAAAARPGYSCPCPANVEEALQTIEFQLDIRYLLEKHKWDYATEPDHSTEPDNSTQPDHDSDSMMDVE